MPKIGRYEIESEIGRGSMGVVYLAHDPHVRRRVAVKTFLLPQGLSPDQEREYTERFLREAQAAGALSHPAIVTIYDADTDSERGVPYIAMEYIEGESLRQMLAVKGKLEPEQAFAMAEILADALKVAHDAGIVHRDIKPANILVRGRDGAVKIADFGVARLATSDLTSIGDVFGSPAYMSPEQFRGAPVDARSDLFSLGTILYQALCGERPFAGEDVSSLAYSVAHTIPPPPSHRMVGLPPALDRFFERALAKDPALRFPDGAAFKRALSIVRQGKELPEDPAPTASGSSFPAESMGRSRAPSLKLRGKGVSTLEGVFAVAMLLLALLPGLWALRGASRSSASAPSPGPQTVTNAESGTAVAHAVTDTEKRLIPTKLARSGLGGVPSSERVAGATSDIAAGGVGGKISSLPASANASKPSASGRGNPAGSEPAAGSLPGGKVLAAKGGATKAGTIKAGTVKAGTVNVAGAERSKASGLAGTSPASGALVDPDLPTLVGGIRNKDSLADEVARLEEPAAVGQAGSGAEAYLLIDAKSNVKDGTLKLFIDGREVYSRRLSTQSPEAGEPAPKKKWYKRRQESFEARIEIAPGKHEIVAEVQPEGMASGYKDSVVVEVDPSGSYKLHLIAGRLLGSPLSLKLD